MGSTPIIGTSKNVVLLGKNVRFEDFVDCEQSRTKTHENTVYSSSMCQVKSRSEDLQPVTAGKPFIPVPLTRDVGI